MAKFIVTVVVETDNDEKPPTKKVIKAFMHEAIGIRAVHGMTEPQYAEVRELFATAKARVRSVEYRQTPTSRGHHG